MAVCTLKHRTLIPLTVIIVILALLLIWCILRRCTVLPVCDTGNRSPQPYSEEEAIQKAMALCTLSYGCERSGCDPVTVNEALLQRTYGIIAENYGIARDSAEDPTTALFDTAEYICNQVGEFRFLCDLKDEASGFYGAAFSDDVEKCVWICYNGATSFRDACACAGMVVNPKLTHQERCALAFLKTVLTCTEISGQSYTPVLTGHSLGGALASMASYVSGYDAITINGANRLGFQKARAMRGTVPNAGCIVNCLTKPKGGKLNFMSFVQYLMYLGSPSGITEREYPYNAYTKDTHSVFSFIQFADENDHSLTLPTPLS